MRRLVFLMLVLVAGALMAPPAALAQGGGASTTGTIAGRVSDTSGGVLPGVSVTAGSPSMLGTQTSVTNEQGLYRFPAVPPGTYTLTYEIAGFNTLRREGIQITLGFTATINVELTVATLQETVTVTGQSPVIDTAATRVQQNFKLDQLQSIPNARDMWSLLAVTPSVTMSRIDVGGNRAGTQTGYNAYGYSGQVRVLVEGINTTEGTGGAGFYFDYGSFEEVFLGTAGNGAEMPHPGVQSQFLGKSGGNSFQGEVYLDWYNNSLQGSNLPQSFLARGIRKGSNEIEKYYDTNINVGGPIRKDEIWWYFSYRDQKNAVQQVNFLFDKTFDTRLWNPSGKVTYQLSQNHKFIGYYQWGQKIQPNRLFSTSYTYASPEYTRLQDSGSWVWKGEWNGTLSNNLYVETRYGDFGYYFPLIGYSGEPWRHDTGTRVAEGGDQRWQQDRDRKQLTGAATYFKDGWAGSHSFKFGGEFNLETQWNGYQRIKANNIEHVFNNGPSRTVRFGFPTADGPVGSYGARKHLLAIAKLDHSNLFLSDQWALGRVTLNLGLRYDHYRSWVPEQRQLASTTGPFSVPELTFAEQTFFTWDSVAPRAGLIYDLAGTGRTVVKVNYGYFGHNPGPGIAASANPNQASKDITFEWFDRNGNRLYDLGEEGAVTATNLAGTISIDPNITQPYTHEVALFLERELMPDFGVRIGYVYKTEDNDWFSLQPGRPFEAYTVPFTALDIGVDGLRGTTDDRNLTFFGLPRNQLASMPPNTVIGNTRTAFEQHRTFEVSANKRMSRRWSMSAGFGHTWTTDSLNRNNPNVRGEEDSTRWSFKASGTYDAPWGIRLSPLFRHQSGLNFARTISAAAAVASGAFFSGTVNVEPINANRDPNIRVLDLRAEKNIPIRGHVRVRAFLDLFNILNAHSPETLSHATGVNYLLPTVVLAPRTSRIGFRFIW
ncbi:MAG: carboxypeptidase regulatory-like domain-containing protein [Acidobacteria bacterium]|nr:carboxypeptidase regulatory-like domain-containing protein [Acidobacteriota bacterium]